MALAVVIAFIIFFSLLCWQNIQNGILWIIFSRILAGFFSFFLCPSCSVFLFRLLELSITICYYLTRTFVSPSGRSFVRSVACSFIRSAMRAVVSLVTRFGFIFENHKIAQNFSSFEFLFYVYLMDGVWTSCF